MSSENMAPLDPELVRYFSQSYDELYVRPYFDTDSMNVDAVMSIISQMTNAAPVSKTPARITFLCKDIPRMVEGYASSLAFRLELNKRLEDSLNISFIVSNVKSFEECQA
ncbi:hypothetical protein NFB51_15290 [Yersinia ruckeri]|nr:hypothetical protein [Yersinia ruckeri]